MWHLRDAASDAHDLMDGVFPCGTIGKTIGTCWFSGILWDFMGSLEYPWDINGISMVYSWDMNGIYDGIYSIWSGIYNGTGWWFGT